MRTDRMAEAYIVQAEARLKDAEGALHENNFPYAVRLSQECVEMSLKAVLRLVGVEYPREHDVSDVLVDVKDRLPKWLRDRLPRLASSSKKLAEARGPSSYGDEERAIPPSELFTKRDAEEAVGDADYAHRAAREFFEWQTRRRLEG